MPFPLDAITPDEAAVLRKLSKQTLANERARGAAPVWYKRGTSVYYSKSKVLDWLNQNTTRQEPKNRGKPPKLSDPDTGSSSADDLQLIAHLRKIASDWLNKTIVCVLRILAQELGISSRELKEALNNLEADELVVMRINETAAELVHHIKPVEND